MLREFNWKAHRKQSTAFVRDNMAIEIVDLLKFVMSLAEVWGITPDELLDWTGKKSEMLDVLYQQENAPDPVGKHIVVCDLDGTIADWRSSFLHWAAKEKGVKLGLDPQETLSMDVDLGIQYERYLELKHEFEALGNYASLKPFYDGVITLRHLIGQGVQVHVFTARPVGFKRTWMDSYQWLRKHQLDVSSLELGSESRIVRALRWLELGNKVVMFEDNPELMLRAAHSGIRVIARSTPYNHHLFHPRIVKIEKFVPTADYFGGL